MMKKTQNPVADQIKLQYGSYSNFGMDNFPNGRYAARLPTYTANWKASSRNMWTVPGGRWVRGTLASRRR
ncbi:hypothetical protein [Edaphobacter sp. HDX4]|uniref:hypothetical protein n=1 Tax=Edaphobacter sp. HDX4 TaxID=2794064 RepID=UPI002FE5C83C